jgi:NADH:ubiquinone oxidoreductase subunit E
MQTITTVGLDIAKSVFQVHGVECRGQCHPSPPVLYRRNDPELGQMGADRIDHRGLLADKEMTGARD